MWKILKRLGLSDIVWGIWMNGWMDEFLWLHFRTFSYHILNVWQKSLDGLNEVRSLFGIKLIGRAINLHDLEETFSNGSSCILLKRRLLGKEKKNWVFEREALEKSWTLWNNKKFFRKRLQKVITKVFEGPMPLVQKFFFFWIFLCTYEQHDESNASNTTWILLSKWPTRKQMINKQ